jgi:16S rRNA (cytidine1402-2'-O)-methyltransferase
MTFTLRKAVEFISENEPRGEYVLVLEGADEEKLLAEQRRRWESIPVSEHVERYLSQGMDKKEAMKQAAKDRGVSKRDIYNALLP